jgi:AcrR family transcriptional regulator
LIAGSNASERPGPTRGRDTGLEESPFGGRATREGILDVAAQLLVSQGLAEVSVESVASRAQVESSLIARWWPSEDALALDTLRHVWLGLAVRVRHGAARVGL